MNFRREYNGCKSFGCPNCGVADLSLYSRSNRLGYDAWYCPLCGAYPPVLLNEPILCLAEQIHAQHLSSPSLESCGCSDPQWKKHGLTQAGSQRVKCKRCGKSATLLNAAHCSPVLQPLLNALLEGILPSELQNYCGLSNKAFAQRIEFLADVLRTFSRQQEQHCRPSALQIRSHIQCSRSGSRHQDTHSLAAHLWSLSSCDSTTGYTYLISDNALFDAAELPPSLAEKTRYQMPGQETASTDEFDVFVSAEKTYAKILARSQFDQLGYSSPLHQHLKEGLLLRPVYAAHAHMQNLRLWFGEPPPKTLILEHESFLRGAAITAFSDAVKAAKTTLLYCHLAEVHHFDTNKTKSMSWWDEKWMQFNQTNEWGDWQIGLGLLTPHTNLNEGMLKGALPEHPNWNRVLWQDYEQWLPPTYCARLSLKRIHQWQEIYRFLFNYLLPKTPRLEPQQSVHLNEIASLIDSINDAFLNSNQGMR
ncbi:hypothetical protein FXE63_12150 [Vibrio mimicus]|uniref:hypothetical protein n=1 Tax=Vibrio mimicus TaxID=674 RepID=UPI0011D88D48|nr:hypothetical protein [Vibrio mimicus]TXZ07110.1 hypothetical protein FXE63_12150 [Vibrio mimicus]